MFLLNGEIMNSHELGCEVQMIKEITSSEGAIKRYFLGKNDGIVLKNGIREVNTGFGKLNNKINSVMNILESFPNDEKHESIKKELIKAKGWFNVYMGNKERIYKVILEDDENLLILRKSDNGSKVIDVQLIKDELGEEKSQNILSQYFIKNQLKIRQNISRLDKNDLLVMVNAFSEKNKIGLNNNEHYITVNLQKIGPLDNQELSTFLTRNPDSKYKNDDYYYNTQQAGWRSFRNSETVQLAYFKEKINQNNDLKMNFSRKDESMSCSDTIIFKEEIKQERRLPVRKLKF